MGFDLSFTLSRDEVLTASELDTLEQHLRKWRARIVGYDWRVPDGETTGPLVAWGSLRPTRGRSGVSDEGGYLPSVVDALHNALAELRDEIPGVKLAFADDFGAFAWTGGAFDYRRDAEYPDIPKSVHAWKSLAELRAIPDKPARAPRAKKPRTKEAARASVETADRKTLFELLRAPLNGDLSDRERTAVIEKLGVDPDAQTITALLERFSSDGAERPWTATLLGILAAAPGRCSWATAILAFDRGLPGAAELMAATVTPEAEPYLPRLPDSPRWKALVDRARGGDPSDAMHAPVEYAHRLSDSLRSELWKIEAAFKPGP